MQHYYPYIILMFLGVVVFFITLGLLLRGKKKVPPPFSLPMEHIEDKSSEIINVTQTPVPVGQPVQETVTLAGTAPATAQAVNLIGGTSTEITITPGS